MVVDSVTISTAGSIAFLSENEFLTITETIGLGSTMLTIRDFLAFRAVKTANAQAAADGFGAEHLFCTQEDVKLKLEGHFNRKIKTLRVISQEKSDVVITFEEGAEVRAQLKNFSGEALTSHQTNRRSLAHLPPAWQGIASHVCLAQPKSRGRMKGVTRQEFLTPCVLPSAEDGRELARLVLLGTDPAWAPDVMVLTWTSGGVITKFSVKPMSEYLACVDAAMYATPEIRPTTVSICPEIAMQRKGGDKGNESADDLQFKLNFSKDVMDRHAFRIICVG